jgi:type II secretory pathway component GspD/PulD (secretin)
VGYRVHNPFFGRSVHDRIEQSDHFVVYRRPEVIIRAIVGLMLAAVLATPAAVAASAPGHAGPPTLTLDIVDLPLAQALSTLARAAGVDLVVEGQVTGTVTLHLAHQTFPHALAILAQAYRLDVRTVGNGYLVRQLEGAQMLITPPQAQSLDPVVHAYRLRYALASEVADEIRTMLTASPPTQRGPGQVLIVGPPPQPLTGSGTSTAGQSGVPSPTVSGSGPGSAGYGGASSPTPAPVPPAVAPVPPVVPPTGQPTSQTGMAVTSDDRTNTVVVTAPFAIQVQVQSVIVQLDHPEPGPGVVGPEQSGTQQGEQVLPQTYRYAVRYADPQAMAQVLQAEVPGLAIVADLRSHALLVSGNAGMQRRAASVLRALDTPATQILIQTEILDLSKSAASQLGIQWTWQPYSINQLQIGSIVFTPAQSTSTTTTGGTTGGTTAGNTGGLQMDAGPIPIVAVLNALVSKGDGKVLANPQVATQDGVQASINVGQTLYIPVTNVTNGIATTTLQTINAGILLQVTPRLNRDGVVTNILDIQSNSISGFSPQGYPEITTRAVQSIMTVRDGEPILIGGLISQTTAEAIQKIPVLGDLPLIGNLFRFTSKSDQYDNIVIVLTPRVLTPGTPVPLGSS